MSFEKHPVVIYGIFFASVLLILGNILFGFYDWLFYVIGFSGAFWALLDAKELVNGGNIVY